MNIDKNIDIVTNEISCSLKQMNTNDINLLIEMIEKADKVFFIGVGRVFLSLQAMAKRLAHLNIKTYIVGQITEPAIAENDLLIVGSGSGETLIPVAIAKKAKSFGAKVAHIGSNPNSSMNEYSDLFIRIPVTSKANLADEIKSKQPMTSLFEQSLLVLGDVIALSIVEKNNIDIKSLWKCHANLE